jgi:guanylate kinase
MQKIILIAGPSGAGKTTISNYLSEKYQIPRVVTHTTRSMRAGEVEGQSYYFETEDTFKQLHFFEQVKYGNYCYGSSHEALNLAWQKSPLVSLIVEIQGAKVYLQNLKKRVFFIYVTTSSRAILRQRLEKRGDDPETISRRLSGAELNQLPEDLRPQAHLLINDDWTKTQAQLDHYVDLLRQNG